MFANLWFDLRYAWRLFLKSPGHSLLCVIVVALSVATALVSWVAVHNYMLKPLGFPGSQHWYSVAIAIDNKSWAQPAVDAFTYQEMFRRNRTTNYLGAFSGGAAVLSEGQASTRLRAAAISPRLLTAMAVKPHLGRLFSDADSEPGAAPAAIISFDAWQNYFAADSAVIGKQTRINSQPVLVVGVMPKGLYAFSDFEIWTPLQLRALTGPHDSAIVLSPIIVAENKQAVNKALLEMKVVIDELDQRYPELFNAQRHVELVREYNFPRHWGLLFFMMIVLMGLAVTLLGSVNISLVFLARLLERSRELALRTALGASRSRLLRQCLLETALVIVLGLVLGYAVTFEVMRMGQTSMETMQQMQGQGRFFTSAELQFSDALIALGLASAVWLLSTLIPAWRVSKQEAVAVLAGNATGAIGSSSGRTVRILVAMQIFVSCLVLVMCINMSIAIKTDSRKPSGVHATRVMISALPTTFTDRYAQPTARFQYFDALEASIKNRLADAEVAYATAVPTFPTSAPVAIESHEVATKRDTLMLPVTAVSDNYFELLGLKLLSGRTFDSTDSSTSALNVAVVDESTVTRYWPSQGGPEAALGKRIQLNPTKGGPWLTIVGVVSHARIHPIATEARQAGDRDFGVVYQPLRQITPASFHLMVKLPASAPTSAIGSRVELRAAAFAIDRDLPLHNLQMVDEYLEYFDSSNAGIANIFEVISAITAVMAAAGLFGLISRSVAQRTQEVGVRRALGATQGQVTAVFLRESALHMTAGIVGVGLGVIATNFLGTNFPGTLDHVIVVTMGVLALIASVIFLASYLPTRRAVALEPGDALRYE